MAHHTKACTLGAILLLAASLPGCGPDNEKAAGITGPVDTTNTLSPTESKKRGAMGLNPQEKPKNYEPTSSRR